MMVLYDKAYRKNKDHQAAERDLTTKLIDEIKI